jgi:hypothetical protein
MREVLAHTAPLLHHLGEGRGYVCRGWIKDEVFVNACVQVQ